MMNSDLFGMSSGSIRNPQPQMGGTFTGQSMNSGASQIGMGTPQRMPDPGGYGPIGQNRGVGAGFPNMNKPVGGGFMSPSQPGNSLFGHSQGLGMGQGNTQLPTQIPGNPTGGIGGPYGSKGGMLGQGISPEILQQLMQMFGMSNPGRQMFAR